MIASPLRRHPSAIIFSVLAVAALLAPVAAGAQEPSPDALSMEQALRLDPRDPNISQLIGDVYHYIRRYPVAIEAYRTGRGTVTLRVAGALRHIGIGRTHAGTHVILLIQDLQVRVVNATTGELLRELTIDPTRDYQPPA